MTRHQTRIGTALLILTALIGCSSASSPQLTTETQRIPVPTGGSSTTQALIQTTGAPNPIEIGNSSLSGIYQQAITLTEGRWEGEPYVAGGASRPGVGLASNFYLTGDLNGDGSEEAVAMLWQSSGGSGVFHYLAVFSWRNGGIVNTGIAPIGDRVQVRSARIEGQQIIIDVIQQGSGDAACCPSQKATRYWALAEDKLNEQEAEVAGLLSIADIAGKEWQLIQFDHSEPLPKPAHVTLQIDGNRLTGQAPCNRYFTGLKAGDRVGEINIGQVGATRMACPGQLMSLEQKYFKLLSSVTRYGFMTDRLILFWQSEDKHGSMFFKITGTH